MRANIWIAAALIVLAGCADRQPVEQGNKRKVEVGDAGLRAFVSDPRVAGFYQAGGWRPAWTPQTASALTAAIGEARRHALDGNDFLAPLGRAHTPAARDAALSLAAIAYADALARGRTDPHRVGKVYTVPRPNPDLAAGLDRALREGGIGEWLSGLAPQDAEYRALSEAYLRYSRQVSGAPGQPASPQALERARTLAVNLERRRWLERAPPATRIDVNAAAALLTYWRDGNIADTRRVVVGEPGRETPELGSSLYRLVANPIWTVPRSIQTEEVVPRGDAYMRRNNMEWRDGWIVQRSGPRNSLGLVKFDLLNDQAIYLHDTPAKALFRVDDRHASHGCIRVDDALGFAEMIAEDEGVLDQWRQALATDEEAFVPLPRRIPVRLFYQTAFFANGQILFVPDVYGWDEIVAEALGLPARPHGAVRRRAGDLGP